MNFKNIFTASNGENKKIVNKVAKKKLLFSASLVIIIIVSIVALNILATVADNRLHLSFDLTADKVFSMSEANTDYLKEVDKDITITFCATEDEYIGGFYDSYVANYNQTTDPTGKYFSQTVEIAKDYTNYNSKIKVQFVDVQSNEFASIRQKYPSVNFNYGDILVESSFLGSSGTMVNRHKIIGFSNIYSLSDESGYASQGYDYYKISGNNIETQLTSAIYYVTSEETAKAAYFSTHSTPELLEQYLIPTLELNNYEVEKISDMVITEASIPEDTDVLLIAGVTSDFTPSELDVIDEWLYNDNKKGNGLVFFASTSSPELPNLYSFLEEWGISIGSGILYETDSSYTSERPTNMLLSSSQSNITLDVNSKLGAYLADNLVPMSVAYNSYEDRTAQTIMQTSSSVVIAPSGIDADSWKPDSSYKAATQSVAIVTSDTSYEENTGEGISSYVAAFASSDFIFSDLMANNSILNLDMTLSVTNLASGNGEARMTFTEKEIDTQTITDITTFTTNLMFVIFVIIVPLGIIAACIIVYARRRSR